MNPNLASLWRSFIPTRLVLDVPALLALATFAVAGDSANTLGSQQLGGEAITSALLNPNVTFEAIVYDIPNTGAPGTSRATPPNCVGDIGPTQFLVCVNGRIRTFNRSGVADGALELTTNAFFDSVRGGEPTADPRVRYDRLSGRWFITMRTVSIPPASNRMVLAVSDGGNIANSSSFTFFQFPVTVDLTFPVGSFFDFPSLGVDKFALYIGGNSFEFNPDAPQDPFYTGTAGYVVRKADLLGGSLSVTPLGLMGDLASPQAVDNDDPNATEGYFVGVDIGLFGQLDVMRISNPTGTPVASQHNLTVPLTNYPKGGVLARGSTIPLDDVDDSLLIARMHKGSLWTSHNISVLISGLVPNDSSDGDRDASRWYEITNLTATPVLNKWGTLFDNQAVTRPREYWMPSCAMSGQGHMAIVTSAAREGTGVTEPAGEFAGIAASGRFANDPTGGPGNLVTSSFTQQPVIAQAGLGAYNLDDGSNPRHWGDYSSVTVDPMDDMTFWSVHEYCNGTDSWGVRVIQFKAPPPATPASANQSSVEQGQTNINVVITGNSSNGSAFFDPGVGYPNRISATVNGGGVTVNSIVFTDPAHITLNVTVASNAALGARTVSVTNPDGQSATSGSGILTVVASTTCLVVPAGTTQTTSGGVFDCIVIGEGGTLILTEGLPSASPQSVAETTAPALLNAPAEIDPTRLTKSSDLELPALVTATEITRSTENEGTYRGLLDSVIGEEKPGFVTVTVNRNSRFTGSIKYRGRSYSLSGRFDRKGRSIAVARDSDREILAVAMNLDCESGLARMTGNVSDGGRTADFLANREISSARSILIPRAGQYAVEFFQTVTGQPIRSSADNSGYGLLRVTASGHARLIGKRGDRAFSWGGRLTQRGL